MTNDRRRKPRVRLAGAAVVHGGATPLACECIDLASNGVGLRSAKKIKKGSKVAVVLSLGERSVALHAVVRRCRARGKEWVLGLQFTAVDAESAAVLDAFVDGALHRDVRMYQAQVFLARAGARSLEEVLGSKPPLPGEASAGKDKEAIPTEAVAAVVDDAEGSTPITLDEPVTTARTIPAIEVPVAQDRDVTGPWTPAPTAPSPRPARTQTNPWAPTGPAPVAAAPPEASADLRHAVASALHDVSHELTSPHGTVAPVEPSWPAPPHDDGWPRGDFGDAPPKGGTMIRKNPLFDMPGFDVPEAPAPGQTPRPPSAVVTSPGLRAPEPAATSPAEYAADVSALRYDDGPDSEGRPGRRTTVVDPRSLQGPPRLRPPPLRVERSTSDAASFQPRIDDLDLDDAPTRMFGDPPAPTPTPDPVVKRRSLPGETQIGPAPASAPEERTYFTPPSPFGGGRVREVVPPASATSTMVAPRSSVDAPTPVPIPGHAEPRTPAFTAERGATQVAIPAARTMPYGPVRGESTEVAIPAQGFPRSAAGRDEATGSGGPRPPSPFSGGDPRPPSPFASPERPPARGSDAAYRPIEPFSERHETSGTDASHGRRAAREVRPDHGPDHGLDEAATRLRDHPAPRSGAAGGASRDDDATEEDAEFAAQYGRALTDLDLESR